LGRVFQTRRHGGGFCKRTRSGRAGDTTYREAQRLVLREATVRACLALIKKLATGMAPDVPTHEFEKFVLFTAWRMTMWETMFINYEEGLVDVRHWQNLDTWYSSILARGLGYHRWWDATRHGYDQAFQEHVGRVLKAH